ncbi:DNA-(apurinic or apyrimidinic site) lyase [Lampropedia hyalina DSM 16112]|uniref:Formamidopyrimidine-DNA glycosylase n=1 Tax=Lampropedia hyalina DSM 16112 TaxID=1122156 RepID=A0A1M4TGL9_9BURK|nr:bifunctional DNA-formamidopyrimidine glycosylase/DNA-(apurinic or apyrimidinic site) lyase [Lampropedia hyalina]SHE43591.1 DNA-(apurinic or apyrimidinic site) lyase [Lampropedia hyalina DSM 16112]
MPELPEVEVTRMGIADAIVGQPIHALRLGKPLRWPLGIAPQQVQGRVVRALRRRGKYLLFDLSEGLLLMHLGMSGSVRVAALDSVAGVHDHVEMVFDEGILRLHDPRRFGALVYAQSDTAPMARKLLGGLGVEPLSPDFTPATLQRGFAGRQVSIKQALLAGNVVVGVGNIYACEALFLAGIDPAVAAGSVGRQRLVRLHAAIVQVLSQAIAQGGSTLRDFVGVHGNAGHFQLTAHVYGRAGEPCHHCQTPIRQMVQGQRSTYFCPRCQSR